MSWAAITASPASGSTCPSRSRSATAWCCATRHARARSPARRCSTWGRWSRLVAPRPCWPGPPSSVCSRGTGGSQRDDLARLVGLDERGLDALLRDAVDRGDAVVVGEWWALPDDVEALRSRARGAVLEHHAADALSPGLELGALAATLGRPAQQVRAAFEGWDTLVVTRGVVHAPEHAVTRGGERRRARPAGRARRHAVLATGAGRRRARTRARTRRRARRRRRHRVHQ